MTSLETGLTGLVNAQSLLHANFSTYSLRVCLSQAFTGDNFMTTALDFESSNANSSH